MRLNWVYAGFAIFILGIEVLIALYVKQPFIRGYIGDMLVVTLIHTAIRSVWNLGIFKTASFTLGFAFSVEAAQAFNLVGLLGLDHSTLARTLIGTRFDPQDLIAYTIGIAIVLLAENAMRQTKSVDYSSRPN